MHRSHVSKAFIDAWMREKTTALPDEVAHRFLRVVRIKAHELVGMFDGQGRQVQGEIVFDERLKVATMPGAILVEQKSAQPAIILLQAAIEFAKISQTVQRACEFGVDKIVIFNAENSDAFCFDKIHKKHDKLMNIAIDACRQSGRLFVPEIIFIKDILLAIKKDNIGDYFGFFGLPDAKNILSKKLVEEFLDHPAFLVAVGPEGGLSAHEVKLLERAGLHGVAWAPHVLRTESACLFAIAVFQAFCGRA